MGLFGMIVSKLGSAGRDDAETVEEVDYEVDEDEIGDDESLSVWDAADIWMSSGEDEDYMFGYTEEELRNAL